jgi:hypothetical protein
MWFEPKCYKHNTLNKKKKPRGGGFEYLHRDPAREKGGLKSETVKYGYESQWTRTWERLRWRGTTAYKRRQTRPLVREGAPEKQDRDNEYWGSTSGLTDSQLQCDSDLDFVTRQLSVIAVSNSVAWTVVKWSEVKWSEAAGLWVRVQLKVSLWSEG